AGLTWVNFGFHQLQNRFGRGHAGKPVVNPLRLLARACICSAGQRDAQHAERNYLNQASDQASTVGMFVPCPRSVIHNKPAHFQNELTASQTKWLCLLAKSMFVVTSSLNCRF
ncbi:MAG: hypothetical protein OEM63_08275, partial [Gammaproteobacteria bacterium]|nr:hypothetical protein [Gammaproteobacteria bacterium]